MLKYLLVVAALMIGCTRAPTERELQDAAVKIQALNEKCKEFGERMGFVGRVEHDREEGQLYCVVTGNNVRFTFEEVQTVHRYFFVKEAHQ